MNSKLHYLIGDATEPVIKPAMIIHCCNDEGGWGRGFVLALRSKFPESEKAYRNWFATKDPRLGEVQFVQITPDICIANMIGQQGTRWQGKIPPIRYDALSVCIEKVYDKASKDKVSVHMPRIGCVLAGGSWDVIGPLIEKRMTVESYVYTLESQKNRWQDKYEN
jgi:O-acetyl-ADP-ribose deacetylase (regulator of RNase III)